MGKVILRIEIEAPNARILLNSSVGQNLLETKIGFAIQDVSLVILGSVPPGDYQATITMLDGKSRPFPKIRGR